MDRKFLVTYFILSSFIGFFLEFIIGWIIKFTCGKFIWIYPNSPLQTSSILVIPLWGLASLTFLGLAQFVRQRLFKG